MNFGNRCRFGLSALFVFALFQPASADHVDYVIHISVDALRGDVLRNLVANAPATYPNFRRLELEGAYTYNARSDYDFTETIPNHATILTGRPVSQPAGQPNTVHHGYTSNFPGANHTLHANGNPNVPYKSSVFDVAHDHGLRTSLYASKTRLTIFDRSYDATNGATDLTGADNGRDKIDVSMLVDGTSAGITNTLVTNMTANPTHYTFIHLVEPDTVGHQSGWENAAWAASVQTIDSRIGQIFNLVQSSAALAGHTAVAEVAVAEHEVKEGVKVIAAWVVTRPEATQDRALAQAILETAADRLAPYKRPRELFFVPALPRTANGKLARRRLSTLGVRPMIGPR